MTPRSTPVVLRGVLELIDARTLSSEDLLGRYLADHNPVAFRALVERYAGVVARRCRAVLRGEDLAEDAFQETFLRLVTHGHAVRRAGRVGRWLAVTAASVAANLRMRADRRRRHEMAAGTTPDRAPPADPAAKAEAGDARTAVMAELGRLPDRFRLPLECVYLDGMTHAEAARALGWPKGTVDSAVARGLARLRARSGRLGLAGILATAGGLEAVLAAGARPTPLKWVAAAVRAAASASPRRADPLAVARAYATTRSVGLAVAAGAVGLAVCLGVGITLALRPAPPQATQTHPAGDGPAPAETLADRNRRVLEADTLPRVVEALRPLALNGGEVRVTRLVAHDFRAWFEVELRHRDAPPGLTMTRFRVYFATGSGSLSVRIDRTGTGKFLQLTLDKPIILLRVPELKIEVVLRSEPLDAMLAALRDFPTDLRAVDAEARHCDEVARALTPLAGVWRYRGDPGVRTPVAVPPRPGPDDASPIPGPSGTIHLHAKGLEVGPDGRFRIWGDEGWYRLSGDGRRLELTGSDAWWEREPAEPGRDP